MLSTRALILAAPRTPSPLFKLAIVLLTLVQIIAPSWHVCELGGYSCHSASAQTKIWTPKCGGGPVCPCEKPPDATLSLTGQILDGHSTSDHGTCLALLLMSMPGAVALGFALVLSSTRVRIRVPLSLLPPCCALLQQPPARGPPRLSFA